MYKRCYICGAVLDQDRLEALEVLEVNPMFYTCLAHASNSRNTGCWSGESGGSQLIVTDNLGADKHIAFNDIEKEVNVKKGAELVEEISEKNN